MNITAGIITPAEVCAPTTPPTNSASPRVSLTPFSVHAKIRIATFSDEVEKVAIPIRKGDDTATLLAAVNDALKEMSEDGTLTALSEKYFGTDISKE